MVIVFSWMWSAPCLLAGETSQLTLIRGSALRSVYGHIYDAWQVYTELQLGWWL